MSLAKYLNVYKQLSFVIAVICASLRLGKAGGVCQQHSKYEAAEKTRQTLPTARHWVCDVQRSAQQLQAGA